MIHKCELTDVINRHVFREQCKYISIGCSIRYVSTEIHTYASLIFVLNDKADLKSFAFNGLIIVIC